MKIKIYGELYTIKMIEMEDHKYGFCDYEDKLIVLNKSKTPDINLKSLIHEMSHAGMEKVGLVYEPSIAPYQEIICELVVSITMSILGSKDKIKDCLKVKL